MTNKKLDQFYTDNDVSEQCYSLLLDFIIRESILAPHFIEPSAGDGSFFNLLPVGRRTGIDIDPQTRFVKRADFTEWTPTRTILKIPKQNRIFIGNPPFGKRGKMAIQFFNRASLFADTIGFILPVIFRKFCVHKDLITDMRLIKTKPLPNHSFRLPNGKMYHVNADFQIWTRLKTADKDLRKTSPPPITHPHFEILQYNNTIQALKVFDSNFDLAVPCQGWQDYSRRETDKDRCEKHKQWMLFSARPYIISRINKMDFENLAHKNTTATPGFRKCDVVEEYTQTYE